MSRGTRTLSLGRREFWIYFESSIVTSGATELFWSQYVGEDQQNRQGGSCPSVHCNSHDSSFWLRAGLWHGLLQNGITQRKAKKEAKALTFRCSVSYLLILIIYQPWLVPQTADNQMNNHSGERCCKSCTSALQLQRLSLVLTVRNTSWHCLLRCSSLNPAVGGERETVYFENFFRRQG